MKGWLISFRVGEGSRFSFWGTLWCGDLLIKDDFPSIIKVSREREVAILQIMGTQGGDTF